MGEKIGFAFSFAADGFSGFIALFPLFLDGVNGAGDAACLRRSA